MRGDSYANGPGPVQGSQNNGGPGGVLHPPFHVCLWCLMDGPKAY